MDVINNIISFALAARIQLKSWTYSDTHDRSGYVKVDGQTILTSFWDTASQTHLSRGKESQTDELICFKHSIKIHHKRTLPLSIIWVLKQATFINKATWMFIYL